MTKTKKRIIAIAASVVAVLSLAGGGLAAWVLGNNTPKAEIAGGSNLEGKDTGLGTLSFTNFTADNGRKLFLNLDQPGDINVTYNPNPSDPDIPEPTDMVIAAREDGTYGISLYSEIVGTDNSKILYDDDTEKLTATWQTATSNLNLAGAVTDHYDFYVNIYFEYYADGSIAQYVRIADSSSFATTITPIRTVDSNGITEDSSVAEAMKEYDISTASKKYAGYRIKLGTQGVTATRPGSATGDTEDVTIEYFLTDLFRYNEKTLYIPYTDEKTSTEDAEIAYEAMKTALKDHGDIQFKFEIVKKA